MFFRATLCAALAVVCGLVQATPTPRAARVGDATWFNPGLGACGIVNSDSDFIVAISGELYDSFNVDSNPNHNPLCGTSITARTTTGRSVTVKIEDRCAGCAFNDIDLSPAAFSVLADLSVGRLHGVTWNL